MRSGRAMAEGYAQSEQKTRPDPFVTPLPRSDPFAPECPGVGRNVSDKPLLALMGRYPRAGVLVGETLQATESGTSQGGGPLSPLLANILLDDLDRELERRGHRFARYADDLVILVKSHRAGERVMASVTRFLTRELKLGVNEHKSRVVKTNDWLRGQGLISVRDLWMKAHGYA